MRDKVVKYVDHLFGDAQQNQQLSELKEEITINLMEKIIDLMVEGKSEDEAFKDAVASLGDISELVDRMIPPGKQTEEVKANVINKPEEIKKAKDPHIFMGTLSGALWIFAFALFFIIGFTAGWKYSWLTFVFATGIQLLVVASYLGKMNHRELDDELDYDALMGVLSAALWILSFGLFFVIGFSFGWKFSWLVFVIVIVVQLIFIVYYSRKGNGNFEPMVGMGLLSASLWILAFALFVTIGFTAGWKYSWLTFVFATGIQVLMAGYFVD